MKFAALPANEKDRLAALLRYDVLDTDFELAYNELTRLASHICRTPIALISLVDANRQWFKSKVGIEASETSREISFCAHAILQEDIFIVHDTLKDVRFADNPLVTSDPNIRFYAGVPLITNDGFALGTLCAIDRVPRDLDAEQKEALTVLAKQVITHLELRQSFRQLQEHTAELQRLNANKDKFFSIIAHDLRSPFSGLLGISELLATESDVLSKEEIQKMSKALFASTRDVFKLIQNLLQWAQFETGTISFNPSPLALDNVVTSSIALLSGLASQKQITITAVSDETIMVYADENMTRSIIQNLISNAVKFTREKGSITVASTAHGDMAEISVIDTGVGMNEDQLSKLFLIGTTNSRRGTAGETGTGLGLVLCRQFVTQNGGTINGKSEVGKGTTICFSLPLLKEQQAKA